MHGQICPWLVTYEFVIGDEEVTYGIQEVRPLEAYYLHSRLTFVGTLMQLMV